MRCDQCRYWNIDEEQSWFFRWVPMGRCLAVVEAWRITDDATRGLKEGWADNEAERNWDEDGDEPPPPNTWTGVRVAALRDAKAVVQDGSDYHAALLTQADFFCALFAIAGETGTAGT